MEPVGADSLLPDTEDGTRARIWAGQKIAGIQIVSLFSEA